MSAPYRASVMPRPSMGREADRAGRISWRALSCFGAGRSTRPAVGVDALGPLEGVLRILALVLRQLGLALGDRVVLVRLE